ncbi:MAG: alpha/beta fold hydrolase [Gammaproteobacteria bacterium]|nr:alpha/beta fold hydrolase [Gammaproteobacteria bacterium]
MTRIVEDASFQPPAWLRNGHLQSILPSLAPLRTLAIARARAVSTRAEEWLLDCGEGTRLQAWYTSPLQTVAGVACGTAGQLALLLHGWEGSADSAYVLSLAAELLSRGYHIVRLNLRDHGATHHLNPDLFHSCRLPEVIGAVRAIVERARPRRLYGAGFSLGGNFLLRLAASGQAPALLAGVAAVSPVLEPARTLDALESGVAIYQRYFVRKWLKSLRRKQSHWPDRYDIDATLGARTLRGMTAALVERHTDYPTLEDYLSGYAITGSRLATLAVPTQLLIASDDPIIPAADLQRLAATPALTVVRTRHGGHCGFIDRPGRPSHADRFVVEAFGSFERAMGAEGTQVHGHCPNRLPGRAQRP